MTQLKTPMLPIDTIEIEEGFNVRKTMDKAKLEHRMSRSGERNPMGTAGFEPATSRV